MQTHSPEPPAPPSEPLLGRAVLDPGELLELRPWLHGLMWLFLACSVLAGTVIAAAGLLLVPAWAILLVSAVHAAALIVWQRSPRTRASIRREFAYAMFSCSLVVLIFVALVRDPVSSLIAFCNVIFVAFSLLTLNVGAALLLLGLTLGGIVGIRLVQWNWDISAGLAPMPEGLIAAGGVAWLYLMVFFSLSFLTDMIWRQKAANRRARHELETANVQLRAAERARSELLSAVTHELRTPLVAIHGYVDLMLRNPSSVASGLPIVKRSAVRLQRLIEELINAAEPPDLAARVHLEPVALAEAAAEEIDAFRTQAQSLGVELANGPMEKCFVQADRLRLGQVLANLLDNALRHSDAGGRIRVSIERAGASAVLTVADEGRGMTPEQVKHIFEPFYSRAAEGNERGGMGLGLSICLSLVTAMNGMIQVESVAGRGTSFAVRLPLDEVHGGLPPEVRRAVRALVLDDEVDVLHLMQATLSELGFEVEVAQNGVLALEMALRNDYDLVLLDLNVPGLTGVEVSRRMRAAGRPGRIMLFSALIDRDANKIVAEAQADGFVPKPFNFDALERLVGDLTHPHVG